MCGNIDEMFALCCSGGGGAGESISEATPGVMLMRCLRCAVAEAEVQESQSLKQLQV